MNIQSKAVVAIATLLLYCYAFAQNKSGNLENASLPVGVEKYTFSEGTLYWIRDTKETRYNKVSLFPGVPSEIISNLGLIQGIPSSMSIFLVQTGGNNILFDVGTGFESSQLKSALSEIGVSQDSINAIFITHFHQDHTGGLINFNEERAYESAQIYISLKEYITWQSEDSESFKTFFSTYRIKLKAFDKEDTLPYGVKAIAASGHTPGHTAYLVGDVLIAGDIMHGVDLQMPHPEYCSKYDMDKDASVSTRIRLIDMAKSNKYLLCGMHFPDGGVIDFRQ